MKHTLLYTLYEGKGYHVFLEKYLKSNVTLVKLLIEMHCPGEKAFVVFVIDEAHKLITEGKPK